MRNVAVNNKMNKLKRITIDLPVFEFEQLRFIAETEAETARAIVRKALNEYLKANYPRKAKRVKP